MRELPGEAAVDLLTTLWYVGASVAATLVGVVTEGASLHALATGQTTLGLWELGMGAVALFVGLYLLGYGEALPRVRRAL